MAEQRDRPHPPTFDDYRAMMGSTRAPEQLKAAVLSEARARRGDPRTASPARPFTLAQEYFGHHRIKAIALAACVALLVGAGTTALALNAPERGEFGTINDLPAKPAAPDENAAKAPKLDPDNSLALDTSRFKGGGGYSGPWYNPADDSFWSYEWAGYKYHFYISCTGHNIETITYEIEGERSYFEIIDGTVTPEQQKNGVHVYHYPKTVTFDYDDQESISEKRIVEIYIGFPLSESGLEAHRRLMTEGYSAETEKQLTDAIEEGAARELTGSVLRVTATFADGSVETKSYLIEAPDLGNPTEYPFTENF